MGCYFWQREEDITLLLILRNLDVGFTRNYGVMICNDKYFPGPQSEFGLKNPFRIFEEVL